MAVVQRTMRRSMVLPLGWSMLALLRLMTYGLVLLAIGLAVQQGMELGQRKLDDIRYGYPRSVRLLGYVGHGDERYLPTVLETLNLHGQISIIVIPGGDVHALQVLEGPYIVGDDGPYAVAYPELHDVNGDGHVDLIVTVRNEALVYINENGKFRTMTMEERATLADEWYGD